MSENNLKNTVLDKLRSEDIKPKSKFSFVLKNTAVWIFGLLSLMIGSISVAVIIFIVQNDDWDVYMNFNTSFVGFALKTLPYLWILFFIIFISLAHTNLKNTKKGYKYNLYTIIISSVLISVLFGTVLYAAGVGEAIDSTMSKNIPMYAQHFNPKYRRWMNPEDGMLAGVIIRVDNINKFYIVDIAQKEWLVNMKNNDINERSRFLIQPKNQVRMLGRKLNENNFEANIVMPFHPQKFMKDCCEMKGPGERKNFLMRINK